MSWSNNAVLNGPGSVLVFCRFEWSGIPGALGFGGSQLDAVIQDAASGDSVTDISRPFPFNFAVQTLVASTYSRGIKIDVAADTAEPGAGTGWIAPGQSSLDANGTNFIQQNPAVVFTCTFHASSQEGIRTIGNVFNPTPGRALSVYITSAGGQTRLSDGQMTINTATITVVPTPSIAALLPLLGLIASRRLRS